MAATTDVVVDTVVVEDETDTNLLSPIKARVRPSLFL